MTAATGRRECRKADLSLWPLLYWTTDPTRLPPECAHLSGQPVERYDPDWHGHSVQPKWSRRYYPLSAFDVEDR